jgi:polyisoprenoid-binding protein YceI
MQEHFNENYMESSKYPRATFNGTIKDVQKIDFEKDGTYSSVVSGKLTIKDVTKDIETTATFTVKGSTVNGKTSFIVNPEDYNITIPKVVSDNISRKIKVTVDSDYKKS